MWRLRNSGPLVRALLVVGSAGVITTGATFASLQSQQATLANNSIESATADLRIGTSVSSFSSSRTGFDFKDAVPGGSAVPTDGNTFYLKNYGTALLSLKMSVGSSPTATGGIDFSKVTLQLTRVDIASAEQDFLLSDLISSYAGGGLPLNDNLAGGATGQYKVKVALASDAFNGQSATISDVDLVFAGAAVVQ